MKRNAQHLEEHTGSEQKKQAKGAVPLKELDFSVLPAAFVRMLGEAVDAALDPQSRSPIALDVCEGGHCESVAYWPKNRAVGLWFLQALAVLKQRDIGVHCEFVAALSQCLDESDCRAVFAGYYDGALQSQNDLGRFAGILELEDSLEPDEHFVARTALSSALYHQRCYSSMGSCESDDESSSEEVISEESISEEVVCSSSTSSSSSSEEESSSDEDEKEQNEPGAPKKPQNGYMFFVRARIADTKRENPTLRATEIVTLLGNQWKELPPPEREVWRIVLPCLPLTL